MVHMDNFSVCIRWTLFVANCFVWLGGSVMLGLAIWVTTQDTEYKHLAGNMHATIGYIALSSLIFIIGLMGTCGILFLKKTLLKWYFGLVVFLVFAEIGIAVYLYLEQDKIPDHIQVNWNETTDETRVIIQKKFECCSLKPVILGHKSSDDKSCFKEDRREERLQDCYTKLTDWLRTNQKMLASCAVTVAIVELFILAGTVRLVTMIEAGDRFVNRITVVPINHKNSLPGQVQPSSQTEAPDKGQSLHRSETNTIQREKWAKTDPKYHAVFTLLD